MPTFRGWIPNVAGRLSFSIAGLTHHPTRMIFAGDLEDAGTLFIGYPKRNLSDTSIPFVSEWIWLRSIIDRYLYAKDGNLFFVAAMLYSKDEDRLDGDAFFFDQSQWRPQAKQLARAAMASATKHPRDSINVRLCARLAKHCMASAKFAIERNGVIKINIKKTLPIQNNIYSKTVSKPFARSSISL